MIRINSQWSFEDAVTKAFERYVGGGITSTGYRNSILKAWGNVVGRERALSDFSRFVEHQGGLNNAAEYRGMSIGTLRGIRRYFDRLQSNAERISIERINDHLKSFLSKVCLWTLKRQDTMNSRKLGARTPFEL